MVSYVEFFFFKMNYLIIWLLKIVFVGIRFAPRMWILSVGRDQEWVVSPLKTCITPIRTLCSRGM